MKNDDFVEEKIKKSVGSNIPDEDKPSCSNNFYYNSFSNDSIHNPFLVRKIPPQNVAIRLRNREFGLFSKPNLYEAINQRKFYLSIVPNTTISNVEKPPCFLRKFSPDGRFLIAFSSHQSALEIYEFVGVAHANEILNQCSGISAANFCDVTFETSDTLANVRRTLFQKLFRLRHTTRLARENEQLNRECSLFSSDSKYVVVVASVLTPEDNVRFSDILRNNESLPMSNQIQLEDYWVYCVDLVNGQVTDTKTFKCDKIYLAHNQGLCLYERTLAVLSVQHQTIHLFNLTEEGLLIELQSIGRFLYDDDDMTLNASERFHSYSTTNDQPQRSTTIHHSYSMKVNFSTFEDIPSVRRTEAMEYVSLLPSSSQVDRNLLTEQSRNIHLQPGADPMFTALKQNFLAFLFRTAMSYADDDERMYALRNFFRHFDFFRRLRIWRMQILDDDNLLLRYATEEVVTYRVDSAHQNSFFVFYNLSGKRIFAVYENVDEDFLRLYENFADNFRYTPSLERFPCSISSSVQARKNHDRYKQTILNARFGGKTEAVKRIVAQLPLSSQSFSSSPYLDLELFSYDEKWLSSLERPKTCGDYPIRVYGRDSCLLKFEMVCGVRNRVINNAAAVNPINRSLVAFIFHPYEPFAISVQRNNRDYIVNFHVRNTFDNSL